MYFWNEIFPGDRNKLSSVPKKGDFHFMKNALEKLLGCSIFLNKPKKSKL